MKYFTAYGKHKSSLDITLYTLTTVFKTYLSILNKEEYTHKSEAQNQTVLQTNNNPCRGLRLLRLTKQKIACFSQNWLNTKSNQRRLKINIFKMNIWTFWLRSLHFLNHTQIKIKRKIEKVKVNTERENAVKMKTRKRYKKDETIYY